jgi:hypothetical protein
MAVSLSAILVWSSPFGETTRSGGGTDTTVMRHLWRRFLSSHDRQDRFVVRCPDQTDESGLGQRSRVFPMTGQTRSEAPLRMITAPVERFVRPRTARFSHRDGRGNGGPNHDARGKNSQPPAANGGLGFSSGVRAALAAPDCDAGNASRNGFGTPWERLVRIWRHDVSVCVLILACRRFEPCPTLWSLAVLVFGGLMSVAMSRSTRSSPTSTALATRRPGWIARHRARVGIAHRRDRVGVGYKSAVGTVYLSLRGLRKDHVSAAARRGFCGRAASCRRRPEGQPSACRHCARLRRPGVDARRQAAG